nr:truncated nef protein [Human immunodeficiency virus 1]
MGGKWSRRSGDRWPAVRERMSKLILATF